MLVYLILESTSLSYTSSLNTRIACCLVNYCSQVPNDSAARLLIFRIFSYQRSYLNLHYSAPLSILQCTKLWANWACANLGNLSALQSSCTPSCRLSLPTRLQCVHQDYKIFYKPDSRQYMLKHYHKFAFFQGCFL